MASNFSSLRSSRKDLLDKLAQEAKKEAQKAGADERFWKLTTDAKTKVGHAVIRFMPAPQNEDMPWVRRFSHQFKGLQGQWMFENCPTSVGRQCPVCKENNKLWNSGVEADKNIARDRKRKQKYLTNILVIEDPAHPENNGKVFLYEFGPKINDKVKEQIEPEFPDQEPMNPFDLWEGANFKLRSRDYQGFQNYDKSEFDKPSVLFGGDDAKLEEVWLKAYPLRPFVAEKEFKAYEELEKKLTGVLTGTGAPKTAEEAIKQVQETATPAEAEAVAEEIDKKSVRSTRTNKPKPATKPAPEPDPEPEPEEDEVSKFFADLDD